jgi:hypothetical protein
MAFGVAPMLGTSCVLECDRALLTNAVAATTNKPARAESQTTPVLSAPPLTTKRGQTSIRTVIEARTFVRRSDTKCFMMAPSPRKTTFLSQELSRVAGKVRTAAQESVYRSVLYALSLENTRVPREGGGSGQAT